MLESIITLLLTSFLSHWPTIPLLFSCLGLMFTSILMDTSNLLIMTPFFTYDSTSCSLIILSIWIFPLTFLSSWKIYSFNYSPMNYHFLSIFLLLTLILTFSTNSLTTFYILFEMSLIPILGIILIWGYQPERLMASLYMMIYTISASLPLLISIIQLQLMNKSFTSSFYFYTPFWLFSLSSLLAFLIKLPLYTVHLWLPKAHTEAPVAGSMILASILLKLGAYGLLRLTKCLPMLTNTLQLYTLSLSLLGASLTSILCLRQHDVKELIAYASVSHMSLIAATILSSSPWATMAIMMMNIGHGLVSSLLFSLTNTLYENSHTRTMVMTKGLQTLAPFTSMWVLLALLANGGAPPFINLMSEMSMFMSLIFLAPPIILPLFIVSFMSMIYSLFSMMNISHGKPTSYSQNMLETPNHTLSSILHLGPLLTLLPLSQFLI